MNGPTLGKPVAYGLALSFALLSILLYVLWRDHEARLAAAERRVAAIAMGSDRLLTLQMRNLERAMVGIAIDSSKLSEHVPEEARRLRREMVEGVDSRHAELREVALVDEAGIDLDGDSGQVDVAWARDPANRIDMKGLRIGPPVREVDGEWVAPLAMPALIDHSGRRGWVLADLRLTALADLASGLDTGPKGVTNVMHHRGKMLARAPLDGHSIGEDLSNAAVFSELLPVAAHGPGDLVSPLDGVRRLVAYRSLERYPLVVTVGVSRAEVLGTWYGFAAAAALVCMIYALGWMLLLRTLLNANRRQALLLGELGASRETLLEAQAISGLGSYNLDLESNWVEFSAEARAIYAFTAEDNPLTLQTCIDRIHPDDREATVEAHQRHIREDSFPDTPYRVQRPDGSVRSVVARGRIVRADGRRIMVGTIHDITELADTHRRLQEAESQYRLLFEQNPLPFWVFHRETFQLLEANEAAVAQYGYTLEEFRQLTLFDIRPPEDVEEARRVASEGRPENRRGRVWRHVTKDGRVLQVAIHSADIVFRGEPARLVLSMDVSRQHQDEAELRLLRRAIESTENGIAVVDAREDEMPLVYVNAAFEKITGYSEAESLGRNCRFLQGSDRYQAGLDAVRTAIHGNYENQSLLRNYRKNGEMFYNQLSISPVRDDNGQLTHFVGVLNDVSDRQRYEAQLAYQATHDELTGLLNRTALLAGLERLIAAAGDSTVTLLYLDINNFKLINDSLGHEVGDEVLRIIAKRLRTALGDADRIGRMGSNEFLLVLARPDADELITRVLAVLAEPIEALSTLHYLSLNAGVARFPDHGRSPDLLFKKAGLATHEAKRRGHNQRVEYTTEFERAVTDRQHLVSRLHEAMEREEFELHFQPLFNTLREEPIGLEALIRWRHPDRGLVPPGEFIPVCEDSGLIVPLGRWVLREACRHHRKLVEAGWAHLTIAVNVSAMQFLSGELEHDVPALLREFKVPPGILELELTESLVMENPESVITVMRELRQHGVLLSIDDFGTGYSSMAYLHRLPVDKLKIDRSFVSRVENDGHNAAICESILALARSFDLKVIAEGVETQGQLGWLRSKGCDEVQGYLLARPLPFLETVAALDRRNAEPISHGK
ncbi:MAG: hypothetical protein A3E01_01745 [Gammaproteobacteria bacterium RIFCSPHIGHO2_12_FULL_63_22]|nr:MAG: hypothetical protein A3E01_01745 [Gammaproteobacteria bacterium RIFCSPHIGHO2_12_FULL_63_22]